ncbi:putative 2-dehydropantoate 2-reductase [Desulfosudis oleivorans]|nr:putative 2-dehydropantoate 2-reductase [Desulfosudis oleivorans]
MNFAIIGTGAVGGYYGGLLCRHGFEVHFLLRGDYVHVQEKGLTIDSKDGSFRLKQVNAYCRASDMPRCDVVIVALKTTANDRLAGILPHVVKPGGVVVALQNGLGVEKTIQEIVPDATVIGGLCFLCSNKIGPGHIHHLDFGSVRLGQYRADGAAAGITPELRQVADAFSAAGISVDLAEDLALARWQKLVWNMAFNGVTVVLNATTDQLMADPSALALVRGIMEEVVAGARACGHPLDENFIEIMIAATKNMVAYRPSMMLDFEAGRELEVEEIYRLPISMAAAAGVAMPRSETIALQLEFLDRRNRG